MKQISRKTKKVANAFVGISFIVFGVALVICASGDSTTIHNPKIFGLSLIPNMPTRGAAAFDCAVFMLVGLYFILEAAGWFTSF